MSSKVEQLSTRLDALERSQYDAKVPIDDAVRRARRKVEEQRIFSACWKVVPDPYYTWPLEKRAECLGAPSVQYLCKSLLLENRKAPESGGDPTNPKFVLVVVQYAATLDVKKLANAVRAMRKDVKSRLDESKFEFRIASEEHNDSITGYAHNSVTPFGMIKDVPIFLSSNLRPLRYFWLGGGHIHLKLRLPFTDFCRALNPIVADISQPRTAIEMIDAGKDEK